MGLTQRSAGMAGPGLHGSMATIRSACARALWDEVLTYPKPGLVSLADNGSHRDMSALHFWRSTLALRGYFGHIAQAGAAGVSFAHLRGLGVAAEQQMLQATSGVNTHRGAIFVLGLLAAAAGWRTSRGGTQPLGEIVQACWGSELARHCRDPNSHGSRAALRHGAGGALAEAIGGFASVHLIGLPAYRRALACADPPTARVQAFFQLLADVSDTNLLHRAGAAGLRFASGQARGFLSAGGTAAPDWHAHALRIHRAFMARNLSPGGCADLLAATLFVHAMEPPE